MKNMNLSFAGCGFLGIYHVGVACCFRKYAPHLLLNKISGASAGAMAACCLICELPLGEMTSDVLRVATEARSRSLGPFHPSFNIHQLLMESLEKMLPHDAHLRVSGKLHISLTRVHDGKNVIVSQFDSRDELIQALLASAFIPVFSGIIPPKFRGVRYVDGGYSDNLPTLDENTITVSPFCGESDICPRDDSSQLFHINIANTSIEISKHNIYRMLRILFPPKPEVLSNMCKQGFDDALRFLHRNNLISCTRCLDVQSTFMVSDNLEYDPNCNECQLHRQEALVSNMPETVLNVFQEVIDSANKGLLHKFLKYRLIKLLSEMIRLPTDLFCASCSKFMSAVPIVHTTFLRLLNCILHQLIAVVSMVNKRRQQLSTKLICQLAVTEYGRVDIEACPDSISKNKMNLNFTLNLDDSDLPLDQSPTRKFTASKLLKRNPSFTNNQPTVSTAAPQIPPSTSCSDVDTFEHVLQVTSHHDAIIAYYYMDDNNKLKVTEIFDVTDKEPTTEVTPDSDATALRIEFDECWNETESAAFHHHHHHHHHHMQSHHGHPQTLNGYKHEERRTSLVETLDECSSVEDTLDREASGLFSDPESDWATTVPPTGSRNRHHMHCYASDNGRHPHDCDYDDEENYANRPESDQPMNATNADCCRNRPFAHV